MKQLIVLGNGFDLACGLKSSYANFFLWRFNELFCDTKKFDNLKEMNTALDEKRRNILWSISQTNENLKEYHGKNINCDYFKHNLKKWSTDTTLNRWDILFLFAQMCIGKDLDSYEWQDVESIICEVVSFALNYPLSKYSRLSYKDEVSFGLKQMSGRDAFSKIVYLISYVGSNSPAEIASELLNELKKFESVFSHFISDQVNLDSVESGYVNKAINLYSKISQFPENSQILKDGKKRKEFFNGKQVDILSFNYSLDEKFIDIIDSKIGDDRLKTWSNIHGIAHSNVTPYYPTPIFGIDNHDVSSNNNQPDLRASFTKPYRVLEEDINGIRNCQGYAETDVITIYGHSLGRADYSYFETIFDENDLYHSNCKVEYYYYPGNNDETKLLERQKAITRVYNLLTDYGKTLSDAHGDNIVNKLNLENRISVISTDKLNK